MRVIMLWCSRECWNGRQARLRCVWLCRVGSSPISRTKYLQIPFGIWRYFCLRERWDSKGRPDRREGKKVSGGHFLSSWESPSKSRCIQYGCRWILNMSDFEKVLVRAHFPKSPTRTLAPKKRLPLRADCCLPSSLLQQISPEPPLNRGLAIFNRCNSQEIGVQSV